MGGGGSEAEGSCSSSRQLFGQSKKVPESGGREEPVLMSEGNHVLHCGEEPQVRIYVGEEVTYLPCGSLGVRSTEPLSTHTLMWLSCGANVETQLMFPATCTYCALCVLALHCDSLIRILASP